MVGSLSVVCIAVVLIFGRGTNDADDETFFAKVTFDTKAILVADDILIFVYSNYVHLQYVQEFVDQRYESAGTEFANRID